MKIQGFNTKNLNGSYNLKETKKLEFNETQYIFEKDNLKLLLWYDFNNEMYGGRISEKDSLIIHSFYDMKRGWSDDGKWLEIEIQF